MIGRAAGLKEERAFAGHMFSQRVGQPGFANAGLATEQDDLPRPSLTCSQRSKSKPTSCSRPTNGVSVVLPAKRRSALPFTLHMVDRDGRVDAFDQMRPKRLTSRTGPRSTAAWRH